MNLKPLHLILLASATLLSGLLTWRYAGPGSPISVGADPLSVYATRNHSAAYDGIDRWAYYGMPGEALGARLRGAGYTCDQPPAKPAGIGQLTCVRRTAWPLARSLTVRASIDYGQRGRLVALNASSSGGAGWLRKLGWIEPASLTVRGIGFESADALARYAADALSLRGWHALCGDPSVAALACPSMAQQRRDNGLAPLAAGPIRVGAAMEMTLAMERARLLPLVARGPDQLAPDSLLVRVDDNAAMWLDFAGRDLAGHSYMLSIALASEGGTPSSMVARVDADRVTVPLQGTPRRANNDAVMVLAPLSGPAGAQPGLWLNLPDPDHPATLAQLAQVLPQVDPRFAPQAVKRIIDSIVAPKRPDDSLALYPPLHIIEQRAAVLRMAHAQQWLPQAQAAQLIAQAFHDDALTRAAWAMAQCEPAPAQAACWSDFGAADPQAAAVLRTDVKSQQLLYSGLAADHPLRLRLQQLSAALGIATPSVEWESH